MVLNQVGYTQEVTYEEIAEEGTALVSPEVLKRLEEFRESPLNLNTATVEELQLLPEITSLIAKRIVTYAETTEFESVEDLKRIEGITDEIYNALIPYIRVEPRVKVKALKGKIRTRIAAVKPDSEKYFQLKPEFRNPLYIYTLLDFL
ncbi:MAG: helix-hairpin-helix domain-containing protein, partial [Elusimicrobiota bacterium]|nr:helix-hairpin-helix domain-containing protein [Elusimicrobiota bacterium]